MSDAIKFSPSQGTVNFGVERKDSSVVFFVKDHGTGMSEEDILLAEQPMTQVNGTLNRPEEGSGLGLSLAILLTEFQGGTLDIESTQGEGTTVRITIPQEQKTND